MKGPTSGAGNNWQLTKVECLESGLEFGVG